MFHCRNWIINSSNCIACIPSIRVVNKNRGHHFMTIILIPNGRVSWRKNCEVKLGTNSVGNTRGNEKRGSFKPYRGDRCEGFSETSFRTRQKVIRFQWGRDPGVEKAFPSAPRIPVPAARPNESHQFLFQIKTRVLFKGTRTIYPTARRMRTVKMVLCLIRTVGTVEFMMLQVIQISS